AVIKAQQKVGLMLNVSRKNLENILKVLPALESPTVSELNEKGWVAINTIIDESKVRHLIPLLKKNGATGIVEYPINKIIY
ncbi:MAG: ATP phosphoribosyltransferase, partial [bacterium]|nr:ATP phosphoribosyltransferase [bacterium]